MKIEISEKIREIMGEMLCPANFKCVELGFEELCKSKDIGVDDVLVCLESDSLDCRFSVPFGSEYFCTCPLRIFVARKLGSEVLSLEIL